MRIVVGGVVIDTNVTSEFFKRLPSRQVLRWFGLNPRENMYLTVFTEAELWRGAYDLEHGSRRNELEVTIENFVGLFPSRVLPFDSSAVHEYARLSAIRRRKGLGISETDLMIAAIANSRGMAVATRDEKHFGGMGIDIINPWK